MAKGREKCGNDGSYYNEEEVKENCPPPNLIHLIRAAAQPLEYECIVILLFTSNAYPSKPKIDGVGSGKITKKRKMQSTFLVYRTVTE